MMTYLGSTGAAAPPLPRSVPPTRSLRPHPQPTVSTSLPGPPLKLAATPPAGARGGAPAVGLSMTQQKGWFPCRMFVVVVYGSQNDASQNISLKKCD